MSLPSLFLDPSEKFWGTSPPPLSKGLDDWVYPPPPLPRLILRCLDLALVVIKTGKDEISQQRGDTIKLETP